MPRGDRTGPMGMGPMTGRGAGYCNSFATSDYAYPVGFAGGLGGGLRCGGGRRFRRMFYATGMPGWARYGHPENMGTNAAAFDERTFLSNQTKFLENQLREIKERLSNLNEDAE